MAELEKVIRALENCTDEIKCRDCQWETCEVDHKTVEMPLDLAETALSLLKAQEPIEPDVDVDTWICSQCGHRLEHQEMHGPNVIFHEQYSYCPGCGRAVKWE